MGTRRACDPDARLRSSASSGSGHSECPIVLCSDKPAFCAFAVGGFYVTALAFCPSRAAGKPWDRFTDQLFTRMWRTCC